MSESEMLMGGDNTSQASPISSATLYALAQFAFLCAILAICIAIFLNVRNGEQTYLVSNVIYTATACPSVVDFEPSEIVNVTLCPGVVPLVDLNAVRARDLGVPFSGSNPGQWNAITDVTGVTVGHSTIVCGDGPLVVGRGPIRTGVTAVLPQGMGGKPVQAGFFSESGNGEFTGVHYLRETGCLIGPVLLTNTGSVGSVHQAMVYYSNLLLETNTSLYADFFDLLPVVTETWDGDLNDIMGLHVQYPHVQQAIESADTGPVVEGSVGGGTGMRTFQWKSGAGTASRQVQVGNQTYTVGVYVQSNFGSRAEMLVAGAPVGEDTYGILMPEINTGARTSKRRDGSCVVIIATSAPLSGVQLNRLAKRAALGMSRVGGTGHTSSGEFMLAFSTTATCNTDDLSEDSEAENTLFMPLDDLIDATVYATEEAIINSIVAATNMTGIDGNTIYALPHDLLQQTLLKYNRLLDTDQQEP